MQEMLYSQNDYPHFFLNGRPPLILFSYSRISGLKYVHKADEVMSLLLNSGLTQEEAADFFTPEADLNCKSGQGLFYIGQ